MKIVKVFDNPNGQTLCFTCPACRQAHCVPVKVTPDSGQGYWNWNGSEDKPTLTPSLRVMKEADKTACHLNVTDGNLLFHGDSPHSFAGKTIPMVEYHGLFDDEENV